MANEYAGMFTDPNSFRDKRIDDMMAQRGQINQMGGSMSQLLGQVAAGGGATGQMMAEAAAGMFGMSTPEERKAAELRAMGESFDPTNPQAMADFASALNGLGYTAEAVKVLDRRQQLLNQQDTDEDRKLRLAEAKKRGAKPETRTYKKIIYKPMQVGSGEDAKIVQVPMEVTVTEEGLYNKETNQWDWTPLNAVPDQNGVIDMTGGDAARMPAGEKKKVIDPQTGKEVTLDTNTMINSKNKPVLDMPAVQGLKNWWNNL